MDKSWSTEAMGIYVWGKEIIRLVYRQTGFKRPSTFGYVRVALPATVNHDLTIDRQQLRPLKVLPRTIAVEEFLTANL
jgi:hypothetical protein